MDQHNVKRVPYISCVVTKEQDGLEERIKALRRIARKGGIHDGMTGEEMLARYLDELRILGIEVSPGQLERIMEIVRRNSNSGTAEEAMMAEVLWRPADVSIREARDACLRAYGISLKTLERRERVGAASLAMQFARLVRESEDIPEAFDSRDDQILLLTGIIRLLARQHPDVAKVLNSFYVDRGQGYRYMLTDLQTDIDRRGSLQRGGSVSKLEYGFGAAEG